MQRTSRHKSKARVAKSRNTTTPTVKVQSSSLSTVTSLTTVSRSTVNHSTSFSRSLASTPQSRKSIASTAARQSFTRDFSTEPSATQALSSTDGSIKKALTEKDLHKASALGDLRVLEQAFLQESPKLNLNSKNHYKLTPVILAVKNRQLNTVSELVGHGASINVKCGSGLPPLYHAIKHNSLSMVKLVLNLGADPYFVARENTTPLLWATRVKAHRPILQHLVDKYNMRPNHRDNHGRTPIMFAAQRGRIQEIEYLLEIGADITAVDKMNNDITYYISKRHDSAIKRYVNKALIAARKDKKAARAEAASQAEHEQQQILNDSKTPHDDTVSH